MLPHVISDEKAEAYLFHLISPLLGTNTLCLYRHIMAYILYHISKGQEKTWPEG